MITGTLILIFVPAAKRGNAEQLGAQLKARTSWLRDMKALIRNLIFGAITCFTGFLGVIIGAGATKWCRVKTQRADPLVCAVGMLGSAIFTCLIFIAAKNSIVGAYISDVIRQSTKESPLWEFLSLGYALMLCPFVVVLGGMFFLATALFFLSDRAKAEQQ
ncbi:hypothetical protein Chor_005933 [Crotalus horridus]